MTIPIVLGSLPLFRISEHVLDLWRGAALPDTAWTVLMGGLVSLACAWLGCFLILQGKALLGDAISHTVLLGIVVAALITGSTGSGTMLLAALITGLVTTVLIEGIRGSSRIKDDAATGIVFTGLFALGVLLLSLLASKAHLDPQHALYGQLEFVPSSEKVAVGPVQIPKAVLRMALLCLVLLAGLVAFYKQLLVTTFDPQLAQSLGIRPRIVQSALLAALSLAVVGAFSSVGAVLVVGLLVAPPATAYLLTDRLPRMLAWASLCGVASSLVGYHVACWLEVTAAGTMVCVACLWFTLAFLFAPRDGVVSRSLRHLWLRLRTGHENLARLMLKLGAVPGRSP
ncbi:MAG: metal ABC transporter permease, partial [Planctomycetaceae bacterium]